MIMNLLIGKSTRLRFILVVAGIWIIISHFPSQAYAQQFEFTGSRKKQVIDFIRVKNLIIIPIYIEDKGPYNFLLDTGVAQMVITDTTFLSTLKYKRFQNIKIQGYGIDKEVDAILTRDLDARVGKAIIKNIPTAIFKEDIFDLSSYLGIKIYGILGYYFFNSFVVRINYTRNKITLYSPETKVKMKGTKIPIRINNAKPYLSAEMHIPNQRDTTVELLIDNGSSHPLMMESLHDDSFPLPTVTIPANLGVGLNGAIVGSMGRISTMKIEDLSFENILSGFPEFNSERSTMEGKTRNGSVGAEILKHFLVTFDYKNNALYLKKNTNHQYKYEHDMSGIEMYVKQTPYERFFISRIEPGSPAEIAGLKVNDEIIVLNFKDVRNYTLDGLTELFREDDGKKILIEVIHHKERFVTILKLKRRI